jgi:hypothetical protein
MQKRVGKRGQLAIFVILAMIIVAIILFFILFKRGTILNSSDMPSPESAIKSCIRQAASDSVPPLLEHGGVLSAVNYKLYQNKKIEYLCYNRGYYKTCINQHPMLIDEMNDAIKQNITSKIENCFRVIKEDYESKGAVVKEKAGDINVTLTTGRLNVQVEREITIEKQDQTQRFSKFDIFISTKLYNLANVAMEIANQEANYCYFEYVGFMALYPEFDIEKSAVSDGTKVYKIKDKYSDEVFNFAVRSCAIPPGL